MAAVQKTPACLFLAFGVFLPLSVHASTPALAREYFKHVQGPLPKPDSSYDVRIRLNPTDSSIRKFHVRVGSKKHRFTADDKAAFPRLDLTTLTIHHEYYHRMFSSGDVERRMSGNLLLSAAYGTYYQSYYCKAGMPHAVRVRDRMVVSASGDNLSIRSEKYAETLIPRRCLPTLIEPPEIELGPEMQPPH